MYWRGLACAVSEALALKVGDVEINARSGALLVRHGKGMKERPVPLAAEARVAVERLPQGAAACRGG